jgi:hypothetical protein
MATNFERATHAAAWLLTASMLTAAALRAVRGERVRVGEAFTAGLPAAGRILLAHLIAYGPAFAAAVALFGLELLPEKMLTAVLFGAVGVVFVLTRLLFFPLSAVVLDQRASPLLAVRSTWALTRRRWGRLSLVALVPVAFTCANVLESIWAERSGAGPLLIRRAILCLTSGLLELLPAAAYVFLRGEVDGRGVAELERVFE